MKSRTWKLMLSLSLCAALAMPIGIVAQDNPSRDPKPKHKKYKLIELGTFGGPNSHFENVGSRATSNQGVATGFADTPVADPWFVKVMLPPLEDADRQS